MADLMIEILQGIGRFFLHPVFYFAIILAIVAGMIRIKRERKDFHVGVHPSLHELHYLFPAGLLVGFILSVLLIGTGITVPSSVLAAIAIVTILLSVIGNARFLSPAFTIGLPLAFALFVHFASLELSFFPTMDNSYFIGAALLVGIFIIVEGLLMLYNGQKDISPKLRTSRRGLTVGALQVKRLWLLPVFMILPSSSASLTWLPGVELGNYSFILVPFLLGFQQQIQTSLPGIVVQRLGRQVLLLGVLTTIIAAASFWVPVYLAALATIVAIGGRIWIAYRHRVKENFTPYYFAPRNKGVMVLDVLPSSPADKLGLKTGEIITKCNQVEVNNKDELYMALQKNRAYCKLVVLDSNNEIRFVQGALYEGDHHELGILFIEKRERVQSQSAI